MWVGESERRERERELNKKQRRLCGGVLGTSTKFSPVLDQHVECWNHQDRKSSKQRRPAAKTQPAEESATEQGKDRCKR